jgi:hypothetical protein
VFSDAFLLRPSRVPGAAQFLSLIRDIVVIRVEILPPSGFIKYHRRMSRTITLFLALTATVFGQNSAKDEAQVWNLEKAYWESVCGILATVGSSSASSATSRTQMHGMAI